MFKKILLILLLAVIGTFIYFAYPIVKNRYFQSESATKIENQEPSVGTNVNNTEANDETNNDNIDIDNENEDNNDLNNEIKNETDESGNAPNITADDCDNECANFKHNESDLRYCQDICGLSATEASDNCDSLQGADKDYCFKNQAVSKSDLKICDSISDPKIQSSCKNRVTEDLLEQQPQL